MKALRRILGVLVMIAGILGLVLSLAGLAAIWVLKPDVESFAGSTITTLNTSVTTSQQVMKITGEALGATVDSVDALSTMLATTAVSVQDSQPALDQLNAFMSKQLPDTLKSATESLKTAQQAATVLDSTIKSLDTFRFLLAGTPFLGSLVETPAQAYNPEKPLADSLGEVATNLEGLPQTFTDMAASLGKADDNLASVKTSLTTMSTSVGQISKSLGEYEAMVIQSQSSMGNVTTLLSNIQTNLPNILKWAAIVLSVFFFWLLSAQIVILSQGWELYQGTAGRMEEGE